MSRTDDTTSPYLAQFAAARGGLPGAGTPWVAALRDDAIGRFAEIGFPTPRVEDWKYTNLNRLSRVAFEDVTGASENVAGIEAHLPRDLGGPRLVLVNGRLAPTLSRFGNPAAGVSLRALSDGVDNDPAAIEGRLGAVIDANGDGLGALNTALMTDGLVLVVGRDTEFGPPVQVVHVATASGSVYHPRNLIVAEQGARATVVESYLAAGADKYWTNAVTEVDVGAGARIDHVRLQDEELGAYHIGHTHVRAARDARYNGFVLSTGAALARNELRVAVTGEGAECHLAGGALLRGKQHADITTEIDHRVPHGNSAQLFKNVLDDQARSVFQGRVVVQTDAQKTDATQSNRNLLLSPRAQADTKPELRIFADDVKCAHGATVGDLDRDAMFYLSSRGIDAVQARRLLIEAFAAELLDEIPDEAIRDMCADHLTRWLAAADLALEAAA